jgi:hypothetical protein
MLEKKETKDMFCEFDHDSNKWSKENPNNNLDRLTEEEVDKIYQQTGWAVFKGHWSRRKESPNRL